MKVALFSDIHFGINKDNTTKSNAIVESIEFMIEECHKNKIDTIFFLGDWFHNRNFISIVTLNSSIKVLTRLISEFNIYFILGNHDLHLKYDNEIHSLRFFDLFNSISMKETNHTIKLIQNIEELKLDGADILLCPWLSDLKQMEGKKYDFIFGHLDLSLDFFINELMIKNDYTTIDANLVNTYLSDFDLFESKYEQIDEKKIKKIKSRKYNRSVYLKSFYEMCKPDGIIFSGHFHTHEEIQKQKKMFIFIGSLLQLTWADIDNTRGFYILDLRTKQTQFVENEKGCKYSKIYFSKLKDDISILANIIDPNKCNYIKLIVDVEHVFGEVSNMLHMLSEMEHVIDCELEYVTSLNTNISLNMNETSLTSIKGSKLDYMLSFIDNLDPSVYEHKQINVPRLKELAVNYFDKATTE